MKNTLQRLGRRAATTALLALGLLASSKTANAQALQFCLGPVGSWSYTVPQGSQPPVHGVDTYSADRRYVTADVIGGLFQTTGIGSWKCTGLNTWLLNFTTLIYDTKTGAQIVTLEYRQDAMLGRDGDSFTGTGSFKYHDATGAALFGDYYTITANGLWRGPRRRRIYE